MPPPHTAALGSWDFSAYLRVNADEGLDPYGQSIEEPAFSDAPIAEGNPLVSTDAKNREMAWPLFLNAASKDVLHQLIRTANLACRQPKPLQLSWRDAGSLTTSYYDVTYARFEPSFHYRRAQQGWLAGTLRVWCAPPYATAGTNRGVASLATAAHQIRVAVPAGSIAGDVDAPLQVYVTASAAQAFTPDRPIYTALSVVPSGWFGEFGVASMYSVLTNFYGGTIVGASGAAGSQLLRTRVDGTATDLTTNEFVVRIPAVAGVASVHRGRNRVLMLARAPASQGVGVRAALDDNTWIGPTAVVSGTYLNDWQLVDLGVYDIDPDLGSLDDINVFYGPMPGGASSYLDVNKTFVLPEEDTSILVESVVAQASWSPTFVAGDIGTYLYQVTFDDTVQPAETLRFRNISTSEQQSGANTKADRFRRGALPKLQPSAAQAILVTQVFGGPVSQDRVRHANVQVRDRFTFAR